MGSEFGPEFTMLELDYLTGQFRAVVVEGMIRIEVPAVSLVPVA